ncbi:hypothetical protein [Dyadobacter diqingensis]|uniref:hypothetical protein n=1 Tax=Dyadobacter diqingensis TaxID=2938121 RepID=UPI0020C3B0EE|nr:hypothetical protein [Dyadobacter diqingensis]
MKTQINGRINELTEATHAKGNNSLMGTRISESGRCFEYSAIVFEYVTEVERLRATRGPVNKVVYQVDGDVPGLYTFRWGRWECLEEERVAKSSEPVSLMQHLKSRLISFFQ